MITMAPQINSLTIVFSTIYPCADQRKHQSSASLGFVREIHRWPVNFPHKGPVTRKCFHLMTASWVNQYQLNGQNDWYEEDIKLFVDTALIKANHHPQLFSPVTVVDTAVNKFMIIKSHGISKYKKHFSNRGHFDGQSKSWYFFNYQYQISMRFRLKLWWENVNI